MPGIRSSVDIDGAKGQMPLRGSGSHWRVLGATLSGSTCSARSGGVRSGAFSGSLNPRDTRTSGQPPPVGGSPFGGYSLLLVGGSRDLCLAATAAVAAPSTTTATTGTTAAPSAARPPSQQDGAAAIPSPRRERRDARRSANGDAIKDGGPVQFLTRRPGLV